jgi:hypothetical protein
MVRAINSASLFFGVLTRLLTGAANCHMEVKPERPDSSKNSRQVKRIDHT